MPASIQSSVTASNSLVPTINIDAPISSVKEDNFHRTAFAAQIASVYNANHVCII